MRSFVSRLPELLRSIASLPSLIFLFFVVLAFLQLSTTDDRWDLPAWIDRFQVDDLDTIRTILGSVITGVFTLTIFAYTMVMNVIDRSISSYSPRLLPLILQERYHQEILGVGAGTIAHSVILLLGIAEAPEQPHPPILAAATAGAFALLSLVLFIYFIHRVSRSIHINVLLRKSYDHTRKRMEDYPGRGAMAVPDANDAVDQSSDRVRVRAEQCGYLDEIDLRALCRLSKDLGTGVTLLPPAGSFVYLGQPLLAWEDSGRSNGGEVHTERLLSISESEPVDSFPVGFRHLVEVAIKAASPAINDPATSMSAINYLGQLFQLLAERPPTHAVRSAEGAGTVFLNDWLFGDLLEQCFRELRKYLDGDPWGRDVIKKNLQLIAERCTANDFAEGYAAAKRELGYLMPV